jgi:hypothetical protein
VYPSNLFRFYCEDIHFRPGSFLWRHERTLQIAEE